MTPDFDIGKYFKERLYHYTETPPAGVWEKIAAQVPSSGMPHIKTSPGIRFYYYAAGVFIAGLVALLIVLPRPQKPAETKPRSSRVVLNNHPVSEQSSIHEKPYPTSNSSNPTPQKVVKTNASMPTESTSGMNPSMPQTSGETQQLGKALPVSSSGSQAPVELAPQVANPNTQPSPVQPETNPVFATARSSNDTLDAYAEIQQNNNENVLLLEQTITACKGEELTLSAGEGTGHRWNTGQHGQTITYTPFENVHLVVEYTDLKGRKVASTFNIALLNCSVFVPKAFSPNDDGNNDYYRVKAEGINNFEMKVFSKWGELVFQTRDPEAGWDGKQKGNPAPAGIYIYQINYTDPNNQTRAIFGTLTLLR